MDWVVYIPSLKQGRKTLFEERVKIVNFTIAQGKDYQTAMEKYGVSYQQAYSWIRKFEKNESQGLEDPPRKRPGMQTKSDTKEERNRLLKMENDLLAGACNELFVICSLLFDKLCRDICSSLSLARLSPKSCTRCSVAIGGKSRTAVGSIHYSDKNAGASISYLCQLLKVSRPGYYKCLHHEETDSNHKLLALPWLLHENQLSEHCEKSVPS